MSETTEKPAYAKPLPDMRPEGDPFWAGTKEHKLLLPAGGDGKPFWYPRANTPGTLEPAQWVESKGEGTVYTYSTHFIGPSKAYKGDPPHIVALVDLDEGVRMMTNLVSDTEGLPSEFGFPMVAHPRQSSTAWVIPLNGADKGRFSRTDIVETSFDPCQVSTVWQ